MSVLNRKTGVARRLHAVFAAVRRLLGVRAARAEWVRTGNERRVALEKLFGTTQDRGVRLPVPFGLGGEADVLVFPHHIVGAKLYVTAELTGSDSAQVSNDTWEQYELAICVRGDDEWPPQTLSRLAEYCTQTPLNAGETIRIRSAVPQPSAIAAFIAADYGMFRLQGRRCGVLLCVGITTDELQMTSELGSTTLLEELRGAGVFPFTDLDRETITGGAA